MANQPNYPVEPAPKKNSNTVLIVVVAVVVLCCLCTAVTGGGGAALYFLTAPSQANAVITTQVEEKRVIPEDQSTPEEELSPTEEVATPEEETPEPTETAEPEDTETPEPTETAVAPTGAAVASGPGMGVSRDEMMRFFNAGGAIKWADPIKVSGVEMVQGTHSGLCVKSDCAVITLAGPADELLAISLAVPLSNQDSAEKLTAITLLMTAMARFTDEKGVNTYPGQMLKDMESAMKSSQALDKSFENNGYKFTESYTPKTGIGALGIARPK